MEKVYRVPAALFRCWKRRYGTVPHYPRIFGNYRYPNVFGGAGGRGPDLLNEDRSFRIMLFHGPFWF